MTYHGYRPPSRFRRRIEALRYDLVLLTPVLVALAWLVGRVIFNAGCVVLGIAMARALGII